MGFEAMGGKKRIGVFLDGTWNSVQTNTNIWRLRSLCAEEDATGCRQIAYYDEGVGTRWGEWVRGGVFGYGLDSNVVHAYRWLVETYSDGDDVFVFGFSRGAFTARSLTGLIAKCGLLRPGAPLSVEQVFERYSEGAGATPLYELEYQRRHGRTDFTRDESWLLQYSIRIPIQFIGVFDTVGALGVPFGNIPGLSRNRFQFHNTRLSVIYENAYQALAIDEHRGPYDATLWTKYQPKVSDHSLHEELNVEQRWFVGAHANVGGGYREDRLAQVPLAWIVSRAQQNGMAFRFAVPLDGAEHLDPVVDSYSEFLHGGFKVATFGHRYYREIGRPTRDVGQGLVDTVNETIDATVFDRWRRDKTYRPRNFARWANSKGIDPVTIKTTVCAALAQPVS
jgi:uncharacterized protein (DUF2235 family)